MDLYSFIISRKPGRRIAKHITFWIFAFIFHMWVGQSIDFDATVPAEEVTVLDHRTYLDFSRLPQIANGILEYFLVTLIPYTYLMAYWVAPRLLERSYRTFLIRFIALSILLEVMILNNLGIIWPVTDVELTQWVASHFSIFMNGPPIIFGLFTAVKLLETWYVKEEERLVLQRENAEAELQLLKAQIHPHFLFNTLNNIYSFALDRSPKAGELVLKLKGLLQYMINECRDDLVPVDKEIKMIEDYISLEKVRYGNIDFKVRIVNDSNNALVAPFLLIPFLENSFKHGTSQMLSSPWVKLDLVASIHTLHFRLVNSKPKITDASSKAGIGLKNAQKRLQLLYKDHQLQIRNEEQQFSVELEIPLQPALSNGPQRQPALDDSSSPNLKNENVKKLTPAPWLNIKR
jgi:hypothetical protein